MGQRPHDLTLSLDDGIPYYPTLTAVAESPLEEGLLYAGTDDGNLQVSRDGGASWTNVTDRLPGLPGSSWISGIEPSPHTTGTVFVAVNNYRNDDFTNYLFRSTDFGGSWTSIVGDLPADRVLRTVREDLRRANVLYLGTEFGLFYSNDGGRQWVELGSDMPTVAINDLSLHPRDNDLILATHGRGIWILDNLTALQELTPEILSSEAQLFTVQPAAMIRYTGDKGHTGDMIFQGQNPPAGAVIDFYLAHGDRDDVSVTIHDGAGRGRVVNELSLSDLDAGVNRAIWDLRHAAISVTLDDERARSLSGAWVLPGEYTVRLRVGNDVQEQTVIVEDDPRLNLSDQDRRAHYDIAMRLADIVRTHGAQLAAIRHARSRLEALDDESEGGVADLAEEIEEAFPLVEETFNRLTGLYRRIESWPGLPTGDQMSQMDYLSNWSRRLEPRVRQITEALEGIGL
jgi:hypothetical protein